MATGFLAASQNTHQYWPRFSSFSCKPISTLLSCHTMRPCSFSLFVLVASTLWMTLPKEIRFSQSVSSFRSALKVYLFLTWYGLVCKCTCVHVCVSRLCIPDCKTMAQVYFALVANVVNNLWSTINSCEKRSFINVSYCYYYHTNIQLLGLLHISYVL